jgi:hypothetical protein
VAFKQNEQLENGMKTDTDWDRFLQTAVSYHESSLYTSFNVPCMMLQLQITNVILNSEC